MVRFAKGSSKRSCYDQLSGALTRSCRTKEKNVLSNSDQASVPVDMRILYFGSGKVCFPHKDFHMAKHLAAKRHYTIKSVQKASHGEKLLIAKSPHCEMSFRRNVFTAKCTYGVV